MAKEKEKYYITTAIAYVNAEPHLGHAMEFIQADAMARYRRNQGKETLFQIGTDEYGTKNYRSAQEAKIDTQQFVDKMSAKFKDLGPLLDLSFDRFARTSDPAHHQAAQALWQACADDIYKASYQGWYCVGCEAFYTELEVPDKICPIHKKSLEEVKEENYFFKLSRYGRQIQQAIEEDRLKIVPRERKNEILGFIKSGLQDISISRPKHKLPWGVEVPGDPDHVMYVWFDALTNYISTLSYPQGSDFKKFWPADVQVIGKDILRFHAAIWPGMLLSAGLPLPAALYVHGFITSGGHKMSKSLGNVISPHEIVEEFGADALRYYLLREIRTGADGDLTWERLTAVYNADLANELGNLVQRAAAMVGRYFDGEIGPLPEFSHDIGQYHAAMEEYHLDRALDEVWVLVRGLNQYIDEEKPWELAKTDKKQLQKVLAHAASDLLQMSKLLEPFMPETAAKIDKVFSGKKIDTGVGILFPKQTDDLEQTKF